MSEPSALSFPDYGQTCADHRRLLVLVRSVSPPSGALRPKTLSRVLEVLDRGARVHINSAEDVTRQVEVRFVRAYPVENNEWGDFQHHRAVLGLISIGAYRTAQEHEELGRLHESIRAKYSKHLLCSRLIALKDESEALNGEADDENAGSNGRPPPTTCTTSPHCRLDYQQELDEKTLEGDMSIFLSTMFWLLEKARVEKRALVEGGNGSGKIPLLCAPFERRDFVGLDMESRTNRKRTMGRFKKHLGDLSLMCGLLKEAYDLYDQAGDVLRSCNDWLWLANSLEGTCAIAAMVHVPGTLSRNAGLRRNSSVQALNSGVSMAVAQLKRNSAANGGSGSDREDKQKSPGRGGGSEVDELFSKKVISNAEMLEYLHDAVVHYSKYRNAGLVETEASVKAVLILIEQNNVLLAADYLQNIVFINLQMNDEEKVHRFSALSRLYGRLGMKRKSAFFHRVAAMRCVAPQNPQTDWGACYSLLLKALPGYNIDFQKVSSNLSRKGKDRAQSQLRGWPTLQVQIMQELVGTSRRMGDHVAATRHMAFLVQALFSALGEGERMDMCQQLSILTSKSPGTSVPHAVQAGLILPPVNIYTVPLVTAFSPCRLPEPLIKPPSPSASDAQHGPFIFTPIQTTGKRSKTIHWVLGETASVEVSVVNPLAVGLKIEEMALTHDGVAFEADPFTLELQPGPEPVKVKLTGVPREAGELRILGYSCVVFGVRSNCRARNLGLSNLKEDCFTVEVSPPIPRLELDKSAVKEASVDVDKVDVFHGEEFTFSLPLKNVSELSVERLETSCQGIPVKFRKSVVLPQPSVQSLPPGETHKLDVTVVGPTTPVVHDGVGVTPSQESFGAKVATKYSGDADTSKGFLRQLTHKFQVTFHPTVLVSWWDVLPGESSDKCYLILDVGNLSQSSECELVLRDDKHLAIDPGGKCRIPLPVDKVKYIEEDEEAQTSKRKRDRFFSEYLDSHVDLRWRIQDSYGMRSGRVSLAGLRLDAAMTERLLLSPVSWTVSVDGEEWSGRDDFAATSGRVVALQVAVDNNYKVPIACRFRLEAGYVVDEQRVGADDYAAGGDFTQRVTVSGARTHRRCGAGGRAVQRATLLASSPGQVCVRCFCDVFREGGEKVDSLAVPEFFICVSI